jgi:signal transduction histidine kinase
MVRDTGQNAAIFKAYPRAHLAIPLMVRTKPTGVWLLGDKVPSGHFDAQEIAFLQQLAASAAITAESARLFESLQQISQDLLRVRAAERMQLSARLHDEPLQRAGAIARTLERALATMPIEGELAVLLDRQLAEVSHLARELRDICAGLRPPILDQGLRLTLRHVVNTFRDQAPELRVSLAIPEGPEPVLSGEALDAVYHVVTESLNNVQRYAHAKNVRISWQYSPNLVEVSVIDDGHGTRLVGLSLSELARGRHFECSRSNLTEQTFA